jgi:formylglycine-generating enzyme required for sulfatase activity
MQSFYRLTALLFVASAFCSFTLDKEAERQIRDLKRTWANFEKADNAVNLKVSPMIFMYKTEVSNIEFSEFLKANPEYSIDTAQWEKMDAKPYAVYYHKHPAYKDFPVVNISKRTAIAYCKWLQKQLEIKYPKLDILEVRLPAENEWIQFSQSDFSSSYPNQKSVIDEKGLANFNFRRSNPSKEEAMDVTAPVSSYRPSGIGVHNLGGNVAEMIVENGFTKGGSWNDAQQYLEINAKKEWNGEAHPTVGFRPVLIFNSLP